MYACIAWLGPCSASLSRHAVASRELRRCVSWPECWTDRGEQGRKRARVRKKRRARARAKSTSESESNQFRPSSIRVRVRTPKNDAEKVLAPLGARLEPTLIRSELLPSRTCKLERTSKNGIRILCQQLFFDVRWSSRDRTEKVVDVRPNRSVVDVWFETSK